MCNCLTAQNEERAGLYNAIIEQAGSLVHLARPTAGQLPICETNLPGHPITAGLYTAQVYNQNGYKLCGLCAATAGFATHAQMYRFRKACAVCGWGKTYRQVGAKYEEKIICRDCSLSWAFAYNGEPAPKIRIEAGLVFPAPTVHKDILTLADIERNQAAFLEKEPASPDPLLQALTDELDRLIENDFSPFYTARMAVKALASAARQVPERAEQLNGYRTELFGLYGRIQLLGEILTEYEQRFEIQELLQSFSLTLIAQTFESRMAWLTQEAGSER